MIKASVEAKRHGMFVRSVLIDTQKTNIGIGLFVDDSNKQNTVIRSGRTLSASYTIVFVDQRK